MRTRTSSKAVAAIAFTFASLALLAGPAAAGSAPTDNSCLPPPLAGVCAPQPS